LVVARFSLPTAFQACAQYPAMTPQAPRTI
jgi:hypothetical protein